MHRLTKAEQGKDHSYVSVKLTPSSGRFSDMPYSFLITTQEGGGSDGD